MKRILCVFSAVVLFLASLCSCSEKTASSSDEMEALGLDCDGYVFAVYQTGDKFSPFGYSAGSTFSDMMSEHISSKEQELNFSLQFLQRSEAGIVGEIQAAAAVGLSEASVAAWSSDETLPLAFGGFFYPLTYLDGILDYTDPKFGGWGMLSLCLVGDTPYGVTPVMWPLMTSNDCFSTVIYNGEYIRELGLPNPWEYYEQGKWTYDHFSDVLAQYTFSEGDRTIPALMTNIWSFALGMWSSNGVHMVGEDSYGNLIAGYETERSVHALEWARNVINENKDRIVFVSEYKFDENFINGDSTMIVFETKNVPKIAQYAKDFGIAPFPLGPDITENERVYLSSFGYSIQILNETDDPETAGYVLNALCDPFQGYETEDSLIDLLYNTSYFNRDQAALVSRMYQKAEPTFQGVNAYIPYYEIGQELSGNRSISELLATKVKSMDKYIEEYLGENYRFLKEIGYYH